MNEEYDTNPAGDSGEAAPPTTEFYAKVTRSKPAYSVTVQSTPPPHGAMSVWCLRDFLRAIDAAGILDTAKLNAEHNYETKHFTGIRTQHVFKIDPDGAS